jgi:V/A-type H+-transporting ATPase subunit E
MSGQNNAGSATFNEKIKDISQYLRTSVLTPAESEKEEILRGAREEKDRIIAQAKAEAERIVREAEERARSEKNTLESSLRIAGRQAVDSLKLALEKEVLKQSIEIPAGQVLSNEAAVKEFIGRVLDASLAGSPELEAVISDELKVKISASVISSMAASAKNKMTLSDESIPSGFAVVLKERH